MLMHYYSSNHFNKFGTQEIRQGSQVNHLKFTHQLNAKAKITSLHSFSGHLFHVNVEKNTFKNYK